MKPILFYLRSPASAFVQSIRLAANANHHLTHSWHETFWLNGKLSLNCNHSVISNHTSDCATSTDFIHLPAYQDGAPPGKLINLSIIQYTSFEVILIQAIENYLDGQNQRIRLISTKYNYKAPSDVSTELRNWHPCIFETQVCSIRKFSPVQLQHRFWGNFSNPSPLVHIQKTKTVSIEAKVSTEFNNYGGPQSWLILASP